MRGVVSNGMMCSAAESSFRTTAKAYSTCRPNGLPASANPTSTSPGLNDPVFEVKLTPNRPDCTGVRGIARDLAAAGLGTLKPEPKLGAVEGTSECPIDDQARIHQGDGRRLSGVRRHARQRRQERPVPDGCRPAESRGLRPDQCARRCDQLHQPRSRPAAACLRCR